ncbi:N-acetylmuramic acid 6-phosphate etherase [Cohaesibacter sp. CAU 1516]|uniref:N-acetylmuramic acid 6-phosphate etherase n=1 Tax=Cohaesibacter sp. CAU 1516 TaxID=2576038 RepID=UPI0010FE1A31|nr:N-acetylmuramic acid 6-phosphate etherase [Cohaesibacter sp. CAU 1516]TLP48252.1 N-acetylmuramic acid 6-phosphate etherase [Cohaesibacter sp. CAU 1516]
MDLVTETRHRSAIGLEIQPPLDIATILANGQIEAAKAIEAAKPAICDGSAAMARQFLAGGKLIYAAAGSSGLMALADASELGGTFGIDTAKIRILMAGGIPTNGDMPGNTEDDSSSLTQALSDLSDRDCLIAISASGSTPYTLEAAHIAKNAGTYVIGIANNPGSPLLGQSNCPILLPTPPEVISGSTRMGAATAQKMALNMLSTMMAIHLGHVHDGMMINLKADNIKLRQRARIIVQTIAQTSEDDATNALETAQGNVKQAILLCAGISDKAEAEALLSRHDDHLRAALNALAAKD